jgi:hypothetical protein
VTEDSPSERDRPRRGPTASLDETNILKRLTKLGPHDRFVHPVEEIARDSDVRIRDELYVQTLIHVQIKTDFNPVIFVDPRALRGPYRFKAVLSAYDFERAGHVKLGCEFRHDVAEAAALFRTKIGLQRSGIVTVVRQLVAASMSQHVRVNLEAEPGFDTGTCDHLERNEAGP